MSTPYSPVIKLRGREMKTPAYRWVRESDKLPIIGTTAEQTTEQTIALVKLFTPDSSWTWYVAEYDPETGDCFGLVDGHEEELGYFNLNELAEVRGALGLPIERDIHWTPRPLAECYRGFVRASRPSPNSTIHALSDVKEATNG